MNNTTVKATPIALGGTEIAKSMFQANPLFSEEQWNRFAARGELEAYAALLRDAQSQIDFTKHREIYRPEYLTDDERFTALANELYGNRTDLVKKKGIDESGNEFEYETTEYEYTKDLLQKQAQYNEYSQLLEKSNQIEENRDLGEKMLLGAKGFLQGTSEGVLSLLGGVWNIFEGIGSAIGELAKNDDISFGAKANKIDQAWRNAFANEDWSDNAKKWLQDVVFKYEEGDYAKGFARYAYSMGDSLGRMLPSMALTAVGGAIGKAGTTAAQTAASGLAKTAQVTYYGSMASNNLQELYRDPTMCTRPTFELMANAGVKTAFEFAIEKTLGKAFGASAIDNMTFGYTAKGVSGISAKSALLRIGKDALQEGIEEVLQDYSAYFTDRVFSIWASEYEDCSNWTLQSVTDAFILGAVMSSAGSSFRVLSTKRVETGEMFRDNAGNIKAKKLGKYASYSYNLTLNSLYSDLRNLAYEKNMSESDKARYAAGVYTTLRTLTALQNEYGETRYKEALDLLDKLETLTSSKEAYQNKVEAIKTELNLTDTAKARQTLAQQILAKITEAKLDFADASVKKLEGELIEAEITEASTVLDQNMSTDDIQNAVDGISKEQAQGLADILQSKAKKSKSGKAKIAVSEKGKNIVQGEVDGESVTVIPKNEVNTFASETVIRHIAEQNIVADIAASVDLAAELQDIHKVYKDVIKSDGTLQEAVYALLYDRHFQTILLYTGDKHLVDTISKLDQMAKAGISTASYTTEDQQVINDKQIVGSIHVQQINIIREQLASVLIEYYINSPDITPAYVKQLTILNTAQKKILVANCWQKGIYVKIFDKKELPNADDLRLLEIRVNNMAWPEAGKTKLWSQIQSKQLSEVQMAMGVLSDYYHHVFMGAYDGQTYLQYDGTLNNSIFNAFLLQYGLTIPDLVKVPKDPAVYEAIKAKAGLMMTSANVVQYWQEQFEAATQGKLTFTLDKFDNKFIVKVQIVEGQSMQTISYADLSAIESKYVSDVDHSAETVELLKLSYVLPSKLLNKELNKVIRSRLTIDDVIKDPRMLSDEVKTEIMNQYGSLREDLVFYYLRDYLLKNTKGVTDIIRDADGDYYLTSIEGGENLLAETITKDKKKTSIEQFFNDELYPIFGAEATPGNIKQTLTMNASDFIKKSYLDKVTTDLKVKFVRGMTRDGKNYNLNRSTRGWYDSGENIIYINTSAEGFSYLSFKNVLLHEFKHVIQISNNLVSGSGGDTVSMIAERSKDAAITILQDLQKHIEFFPTKIYKGMSAEHFELACRRADELIYLLTGEDQAFGYSREYKYYNFIEATDANGIFQYVLTPWGAKYSQYGVTGAEYAKPATVKTKQKSLKYRSDKGYTMQVRDTKELYEVLPKSQYKDYADKVLDNKQKVTINGVEFDVQELQDDASDVMTEFAYMLDKDEEYHLSGKTWAEYVRNPDLDFDVNYPELAVRELTSYIDAFPELKKHKDELINAIGDIMNNSAMLSWMRYFYDDPYQNKQQKDAVAKVFKDTEMQRKAKLCAWMQLAPNVSFDEFLEMDIPFVRVTSRGEYERGRLTSVMYGARDITHIYNVLNHISEANNYKNVKAQLYVGTIKPKDITGYIPKYESEALIQDSYLHSDTTKQYEIDWAGEGISQMVGRRAWLAKDVTPRPLTFESEDGIKVVSKSIQFTDKGIIARKNNTTGNSERNYHVLLPIYKYTDWYNSIWDVLPPLDPVQTLFEDSLLTVDMLINSLLSKLPQPFTQSSKIYAENIEAIEISVSEYVQYFSLLKDKESKIIAAIKKILTEPLLHRYVYGTYETSEKAMFIKSQLITRLKEKDMVEATKLCMWACLGPTMPYKTFLNTDIPFIRVSSKTHDIHQSVASTMYGNISISNLLSVYKLFSSKNNVFKLYIGTIKPKDVIGYIPDFESEALILDDLLIKSSKVYTVVDKVNDRSGEGSINVLIPDETGLVPEKQLKGVDLVSPQGTLLDRRLQFSKRFDDRPRFVSQEEAKKSNLKYCIRPGEILQMDPRLQDIIKFTTNNEKYFDKNFIRLIKQGKLLTLTQLGKYVQSWTLDDYAKNPERFETTFKLLRKFYYVDTKIKSVKTLLVLANKMSDVYALRGVLKSMRDSEQFKDIDFVKLMTEPNSAGQIDSAIAYIKKIPELKKLFDQIKIRFDTYKGDHINIEPQLMITSLLRRYNTSLYSVGAAAAAVKFKAVEDRKSGKDTGYVLAEDLRGRNKAKDSKDSGDLSIQDTWASSEGNPEEEAERADEDSSKSNTDEESEEPTYIDYGADIDDRDDSGDGTYEMDIDDSIYKSATRREQEREVVYARFAIEIAKIARKDMRYEDAQKIAAKLKEQITEEVSKYTNEQLYSVWRVVDRAEEFALQLSKTTMARAKKRATPESARSVAVSIRYWANKIISNLTKKQLEQFVKDHPKLGITADGKFALPELVISEAKGNKKYGTTDIPVRIKLREDLIAAAKEVASGKYGDPATAKKIADLEKRTKRLEEKYTKELNKKNKGNKVHVVVVGEAQISVTNGMELPEKLQTVLNNSFNYTHTAKSKVKYLSETGERHFIKSETQFLEHNAEVLGSITEADALDIITFFENSAIAPGRDGTDTYNMYIAVRQFMMAYLYQRGKTKELTFPDEWFERIERLFGTIKSGAGLDMRLSQLNQDKINPSEIISKALSKRYGIEYDPKIIKEMAEAVKIDFTTHEYKYNYKTKKYEYAERPQKVDANTANQDMLERLNDLQAKLYESGLKQYKGKKQSIWTMMWKLQRAAMLSSPGTWIRNIVSNGLVTITNRAGEFIGDRTFKLLDKIGGKKFRKQLPANQYQLIGTKPSDIIKAFVKTQVKDNKILALIGDGLSKYDDNRYYTRNADAFSIIVKLIADGVSQQIFTENQFTEKSKFGEVLNKGVSFLYGWTDKKGKYHNGVISDSKFVSKTFIRYLEKMLQEDVDAGRIDLSKGLSDKNLLETIANAYILASWDYMHKSNWLNALERVIQDRLGEPAYFIYKQFEPFAAAGWNWFVKSLELTPVGLVKAIVDYARLEKNIAKMEQAKADPDRAYQVLDPRFATFLVKRKLGNGIIGTIGFAIAAALVACGRAGIDDEDGVIKLYVGNIGVDISKLFGTSGILMGIALCDTIVKSRAEDVSPIDAIVDSLATTLDTMFAESVFSDLFDIVNRKQSFGQLLLDKPTDILASFMPNLIKSAMSHATIVKPKYEGGVVGQLERAAVKLIPLVAYAFPKRYDIYSGELQFKYSMDWQQWYFALPETIVNWVAPIKIYGHHISNLEKLATSVGVRKGELTGNYKDIGQLTSEQIAKANQYYGRLNNAELNTFVNNKQIYTVENEKGERKQLYFRQMTDEQKKSVITRIMNNNAKYTKVYIATTELKYKYFTANTEEFDALRTLGLTNVYKSNNYGAGFKK